MDSEADALASLQAAEVDRRLLAVARDDLANEVLRLAASSDCPHREFFLAVLYLLVGDAVYREWQDHDQGVLTALISEGGQHVEPSIRLWARRSRQLLEHPELFDYAAWCQGGLARTSE